MTEPSCKRALGVLLLALALSACGGVSRVPEESFYRLDAAPPEAIEAAPLRNATVSVQAVAAVPLYRDRALLYSDASTPERLQRYHYHYWIDRPPQLLQRGFADYLRAAGFAGRVITPDQGTDADYRVRLVLERFEHQRGTQGGRVLVGWSLAFTEPRSSELLREERMQTEAEVRGDDFSAVTRAYTRAVSELYGRSLDVLR